MTGTSVRVRIRCGLAVAMAVLLAACSSTVVRTPQAEAGQAGSSGRSGASVVVKQGETLYSIARRNGVAVEDIARCN